MIELEFPPKSQPSSNRLLSSEFLSDSELALDLGRCSVSARENGDGFRIETQLATVVNRDAKLAVNRIRVGADGSAVHPRKR